MGDNGQANVHCRFVDGNRQQKCSVACCCSTYWKSSSFLINCVF